MTSETLTSYLKLLACDGIGVMTARKLLEISKDVTKLFAADNLNFFREFNIAKSIQDIILKFDRHKLIEDELEFIKRNEIKCVGILCDDYPTLLKECIDAPILLFYKGDLTLLNNKCLAIVGTRKVTSYGKETTVKLMEYLKSYKITIVSGMAYGIDIAVYHEARKCKLATVGVMGTSFKKLYPATHKNYYNDLFENGLVVTEYAVFNTLVPELFTRRNRIIAGLCNATIVIESAEKGGSLATALFANDYARDVFAVPGKITDEFSKGCLRLIYENRAQILYDFQHLLTDLNWQAQDEQKKPNEVKRELNLDDFTTLQQTILKILLNESVHIDELALQTQLSMSLLNAELMMLELNGVVVGLPGKFFKICQ